MEHTVCKFCFYLLFLLFLGKELPQTANIMAKMLLLTLLFDARKLMLYPQGILTLLLMSIKFLRSKKPSSTILCCTALYTTALHRTVRYCTVVHSTVMYFPVLYSTELHFTGLYRAVIA
jgi:hypothetical protein